MSYGNSNKGLANRKNKKISQPPSCIIETKAHANR